LLCGPGFNTAFDSRTFAINEKTT